MISRLPIGSGRLLNFDGTTKAGAVLNDGTATWAMYEATLTAAGYVPNLSAPVANGTGSASYVAATDGQYQATIPDTLTATLTNLAHYFVMGQVTKAGSTTQKWLHCQAAYDVE